MALEREPEILDVYLSEFEKLKDEQIQRINYRDNMLYINLVAVGSVLSFVFSTAGKTEALLVIPWVCFLLGWSYLINDEKVSAIGEYIRYGLEPKVRKQFREKDLGVFAWEFAYKTKPRRVWRKVIQLVVNQVAFSISSLVAITIFFILKPGSDIYVIILVSIELILTLILMIEFFLVADINKRNVPTKKP